MKRIAAIVLFAAASLAQAGPAGAGSVSDWAQGGYSRVRLVNAGNPEPGIWRAGLEIDLEDGWKTYWRSPGETGVPPVFDWSASAGADNIEVLWPLPHRFLDSGLETIGYKGDVILPVEIRTGEAGAPPKLELMLSYAVCAEICVPEDARLSLDLSGGTKPMERLSVEDFLTQVPERGEGGTVFSATAGKGRGESLIVRVAKRDGAGPSDVFVEGPPDWYLPVPVRRAGEGDDETVAFELPLDGLPAKANPVGAVLTVTAVYGEKAREEAVTIGSR
ncbi:MAG: hypothetical protein KDJ62_01620 [Rhodobiaceae bacterium]|nr:hypothetical protein [Rhodobiaceae bacterium]MCC0048963.1 hypothetical protein [Rhodobiaceae bacterium]